MKKIAIIFGFIGCLLVTGLGFNVKTFAADGAINQNSPLCSDSTVSADLKKAAGCGETGNLKSPVKTAVNLLLWFVGAISIIMIIVAGIKITTSAGNPGEVQKGKMILIYAIAGLVIALLSYAIVNLVLKEADSMGGGGNTAAPSRRMSGQTQ